MTKDLQQPELNIRQVDSVFGFIYDIPYLIDKMPQGCGAELWEWLSTNTVVKHCQ
jgi:hypothetical protein